MLVNNYIIKYQLHILPRSGPLLFVSNACLVAGLGQNFAVSDEHNVFAAEFLLQLTDQSDLNLLECLQLGHGHVDND